MALTQKEINEIGSRFKKHGVVEWPIGGDLGPENNLDLVEKMSGDWHVHNAAGLKIDPEDLTAAQEAAIRKEFNLKGGGENDFDSNPLIPDGSMEDVKRLQKRSGKKSEFDTNPLIPD